MTTKKAIECYKSLVKTRMIKEGLLRQVWTLEATEERLLEFVKNHGGIEEFYQTIETWEAEHGKIRTDIVC